ncbi:hypothetical protein EVAR_73231_1 [Eumeta japonica]|uniref:Regulatory protein zeste n=1 Tax=Eumeta variegata TaxID=151549 RepID=A0A4C1TQ43_EUMVA|nr:hypothetical protein EVAR_73231_1 [Eumeta japonica]
MEKTPRYTQRERNMVLGYAAQYKDIIENKRTDAESNRKKDEVWRQIAKEFNARVYHQRSSKQLRQLYKNMKLLLKKDLCGEGKGNRTFMDLLNTISQQESVAQYISEQMSPNGYSNGARQKYDDDYDDSKFPLLQHPVLNYDGMDHDVIVIKSEDISDNEQSRSGEAMDEDDDDCLSTKDIPEVCLGEEDEELFATDLRQPQPTPAAQQQQTSKSNQNQQQPQTQNQPPLLHHSQQPEITIQNIGGIRVGSIGDSKHEPQTAITNNTNNNSSNSANNNADTNSALSITHANGPAAGQALNLRQTSAEQQLLLNGLGLSAVNHNNNNNNSNNNSNLIDNNSRMPTLQRASQQQQQQQQNQQQHSNQLQPPLTHNNLHLNSHTSAAQQLLLSLNGGSPFYQQQTLWPSSKTNLHPQQQLSKAFTK